MSGYIVISIFFFEHSLMHIISLPICYWPNVACNTVHMKVIAKAPPLAVTIESQLMRCKTVYWLGGQPPRFSLAFWGTTDFCARF